MTSPTTIQAQLANDVIARVEPGAGKAVARAVEPFVKSAPKLDGRGQLLLLYALADRAVRAWAALALDGVGDDVRAALAAKASILDGDSAALTAMNLREYAAGIDDLPPRPGPGAAQRRGAAKTVLTEICALLDMLSDRVLVFDSIEPAERDLAVRHAAAALVAAWDGGAFVVDLPGELRSTFTNLANGVVLKLPM